MTEAQVRAKCNEVLNVVPSDASDGGGECRQLMYFKLDQALLLGREHSLLAAEDQAAATTAPLSLVPTLLLPNPDSDLQDKTLKRYRDCLDPKRNGRRPKVGTHGASYQPSQSKTPKDHSVWSACCTAATAEQLRARKAV